MRICDRCKSTNLTAIYLNKITHSEHDLCKSCNEQLLFFLSDKETEVKKNTPLKKEKKRGRPRS